MKDANKLFFEVPAARWKEYADEVNAYCGTLADKDEFYLDSGDIEFAKHFIPNMHILPTNEAIMLTTGSMAIGFLAGYDTAMRALLEEELADFGEEKEDG